MGRAKLRMELISNEKTRRTTFEKRKKALEKKADELSTLCGVKIGMILYRPRQENQANEPMIWPNNYDEIAFLIDSYKSRSGNDCRYRTCGLSAFFKDQPEKVKEELEKVNKKVREVKYPTWDEMYNSLSEEQLNNFGGLLSTKIDAVREIINLVKGFQRFSFTESGTLMNPLVQENSSFMPSTSMNPFVEENAIFMSSTSNMSYEQPDMFQWPQPLTYYPVKGFQRSSFTESSALMNPSVQENSSFMPSTSMDPPVEENAIFMSSMLNMSYEQPDMLQWPWTLT